MSGQKMAVNTALAEKLAYIHCPDGDIALCLGISKSTFARRKKTPAFAQALDRGKAKGRASLRTKQFALADAGNVTMLIWLGKQYLGQKDVVEHSGLGERTGVEDARARLADLLAKRHAARGAQPAPLPAE